VISDYGDAPGGGAYGDATAMLSALLAAGLPNVVFAGLKDPEAVAAAEAAGIGGRISVALGGKIDPRFGGGPVPIVAEVLALSDGNYVNDGPYAKGLPNRIGATALLRVLEGPCAGMRIMVNALARNVLDRAQLRLVGLPPEDCNILCIKGMDAIRAAFQPGSRAVIPFESGGIASRGLDFSALTRIRRPVWPLDAHAQP
jgi:microcystin degradation protein MlrC